MQIMLSLIGSLAAQVFTCVKNKLIMNLLKKHKMRCFMDIVNISNYRGDVFMHLRSINFCLRFLTVSLNSHVFNDVKLLPSSNAYGKKFLWIQIP